MEKIKIIQTYQKQGGKQVSLMATIILLSLMMSSCALFEGVFRAGMGIGIVIAILVVGLIVWLLTKIRRR
jgi:Flp pilus assembly protein TadB